MPPRKPRARSAANGEGSLYWSSYYNRFVGQVTIARDGDRLQRKKLYGPAGDKSRIARLGVAERLKKYTNVHPTTRASSTISVAGLVSRWIEHAPIRGNTKDFYRCMEAHLGSLAGKRIVEVEPVDVRRHLDSLKVGERTRRGVYTLLHRVFREALQLELVARNPVSPVTAPPMPSRPMRALEPGEVGYLLEAVRGDRLEALVVLALTSTMGPAEMLALRRRDLNLARGHLWVTGDLVENSSNGYRPTIEPPKTPHRRRRIDLPAIAVISLRERLKWCLREGSGEYVFTTKEGGLYRIRSLRKWWWKPLLKRTAAIAKKDGGSFPVDLRLYDLRHTANALMGLAGVPIEVASARMGHGSIKTTADVYGHIYQARHDDAVDKINTLVESLVRPPAAP